MDLNKLIEDYWSTVYTLDDYQHDIQDLTEDELKEMEFLKRRKKLLETLIKEMGGELI